MANWLDLEMGGDLTGWMEFGDQGDKPKRMAMLPAPVSEDGPHGEPIPKEPKEEPVNATCSEKTEE